MIVCGFGAASRSKRGVDLTKPVSATFRNLYNFSSITFSRTRLTYDTPKSQDMLSDPDKSLGEVSAW